MRLLLDYINQFGLFYFFVIALIQDGIFTWSNKQYIMRNAREFRS